MIVPLEVLELILLNCDGKTLLNARQVWRNTVDYLTEKTRIWEWCCREEIPKKELTEYLSKCETETNKWLWIYFNWFSWKNLNDIVFDIVRSPVDIHKISCIAVSRNHIAVGSEDGRLRIFTKNWKQIFCNRIYAVRITDIHFLDYNDCNETEDMNMCLLIAWKKGLQIFYFGGVYIHSSEIHDVKSHSVYEKHVCYEKTGGRMHIGKITRSDGYPEFQEIWFTRIYSHPVTCFKMYNGTCSFLINGYIHTINYESDEITPMEELKKRSFVKFNFPLLVDGSNTQILRDDVVISLYKSNEEVNCDFIEIVIMEDKSSKYSKKLFNTWEIFQCFITCIFLYGNTLVLGVDIGMIYFYHVASWKNLDLRSYEQRLIIGKHPIISISLRETETERKFYVSSKFHIHQVSGYRPNAQNLLCLE